MLIQVRLCDGSKRASFEVSRKMAVEECRQLVKKEFDMEPKRQRLFYRGKQLEDGYSLFDYDVTTNNIIVLMEKALVSSHNDATATDDARRNTNKTSTENEVEEVKKSHYFKVKDLIDICDADNGAWFEGRIVKISKIKSPNNLDKDESDDAHGEKWLCNNVDNAGSVLIDSDDNHVYFAKYNGFEEYDPEVLKLWTFRPHCWEVVPFVNVQIGDRLLVNYNVEEPKQRGFFYECNVTAKSEGGTNQYLKADIRIGVGSNILRKCKIIFTSELYRVENTCSISTRNSELNRQLQSASIVRRNVKPMCDRCKDRKSVKCKECGCKVCGGKHNPDEQLLCDECNGAYHLACHNPPLESLPEDDSWFCSDCKNDDTEIVRAGERLKENKRKAKMASANSQGKRDWGRGMACVGRQRHCDVVKSDHRGHIPGIKVGTTWKYRIQASEDGVHRPHVAGIHGSGKSGALSIVLSGGYEDDVDNGDEFIYTGSGGRDLSGNKRTNKQSSDQTLTKQNLAIAANCDAPVSENGATAKAWKMGKPVRVLRSEKGRKHSKYAPKIGLRYDGLYKVVKYWPEKGQSGFRVWRYMFRRDDDTPAPWTKAGKKFMEEHGLNQVKFPDNYVSKNKREEKDDDCSPPKKLKTSFKLATDVLQMIEEDQSNSKLWKDCLTFVSEGIMQFNEKVKEDFMCICCQDLLCKPVTTPCQHNFCHSCITRACSVLANSCPACRSSLDSFEMKINETLRKILNSLFEGYETGKD